MRYRDPQLIGALAAEYVLGTLRGAARRRFEQLLRGDAAARADVYFWELRLSEMAAVVPPVAPPQQVWQNLRSRMQAADFADAAVAQAGASLRRRRSAWRTSRSKLRIVSGFAVAASIVLLLLLGWLRNPASSPSRIAASNSAVEPVKSSSDAPTYLAMLKVPESSMQWLVSLSTDLRRMTVVAAGDYPQADQRLFQLWWIPQHAAPVALGELPQRGGASIDIAVPEGLIADGDSQFSLAVSREPADTVPSELPNGPVVTSAQHLAPARATARGI